MARNPTGFCYYWEEFTHLLYHYHGADSIGPIGNVEMIKTARNRLNIA